LIDNGVDQRL